MNQAARNPKAWKQLKPVAAAVAAWAIDLVFPPICGHCHRVDTKFCGECLRKLEQLPLQGTARRADNLDTVFATGPHVGVLQSAVQAFKYQGATELADVLARRLICALALVNLQVDFILPVPLHNNRLAERGYNQAEILCQFVAAELNMCCEPGLLRRVRNTKQQAHLKAAERKLNVKGAFEVVSDVQGRVLLLVDDVITTGATLSDCARALRDEGAAAVFGIVVSEPRRSD